MRIERSPRQKCVSCGLTMAHPESARGRQYCYAASCQEVKGKRWRGGGGHGSKDLARIRDAVSSQFQVRADGDGDIIGRLAWLRVQEMGRCKSSKDQFSRQWTLALRESLGALNMKKDGVTRAIREVRVAARKIVQDQTP